MVPITATAHVDVRAALRSPLAKSCRRDLSVAFRAWLLREPETDAKFASLANRAAAKEGAQQDFQTVATLGFAAHAGVLRAEQIEALKSGLIRQAGRDVVFDGVPMPFCFDAVGILGIALGTTAVADADVTNQVVQWTTKFLRISHERNQAEDWHRCLFAAADRQLGGHLNLSIPKSAATADVRTAMLAKGLIDAADQAPEDTVQTLEQAAQEPPKDFAYDRAVLRLAALEWVTGAESVLPSPAVPLEPSAPENSLEGSVDSRPQRKRGRPTEIPDERKRRALEVQGGKARAQILYGKKYPTPQEVKNVSSILKHYLGKCKPNQG